MVSLAERLRTVPGIDSVSVVEAIPFDGRNSINLTLLDGKQSSPDANLMAGLSTVDASFFKLLHCPLIAGRTFSEADRKGSLPVAVINQAMAQAYWSKTNPIGERFQIGGNGPVLTVIGVGDMRLAGAKTSPGPHFFRAIEQTEQAYAMLVRLTRVHHESQPQLRREITRIDSSFTVDNLRMLSSIVESEYANVRLYSKTLLAFGVSAALLSITGIYALFIFIVKDRWNEFGIRASLGATPRHLFLYILSWGFRISVLGVFAGLLARMAFTKILSAYVYEAGALDVFTSCGLLVLMMAVAVSACSVSVRIAAYCNPSTAIRSVGRDI